MIAPEDAPWCQRLVEAFELDQVEQREEAKANAECEESSHGVGSGIWCAGLPVRQGLDGRL